MPWEMGDRRLIDASPRVDVYGVDHFVRGFTLLALPAVPFWLMLGLVLA